jgi:hypothetical protein
VVEPVALEQVLAHRVPQVLELPVALALVPRDQPE